MNSLYKSISYCICLMFVLVICTGFYSYKKGDCKDSEMIQAMVDRLGRFTLIQEFSFLVKKKSKDGTLQYKKLIITLNRGVRYKFFAVKSKSYDGLPVLSIFNNEKQEFLLGSTYNATFKRFYNELEFDCKSTGNYCLSLNFLDGVEGCAIGVFSSLVKE